MELESLKCPCCGESNLKRDERGFYHCAYCDSLLSPKDAASYAERVEKILLAKGEADIGRLRFLLNEELAKPFYDKASIELTCRDIQALVPEDFKAAFVRAFIESKRFPGNYDAFLNKYKKIPLGAFDKKFAYPLMVDLCPYAHLHTVKEFLLAQGDYEQWSSRLEKAKKERMEENERFANIERDVFICHSSFDFARIAPIIKYLEEDGFTCWYSQRNLPKDVDNYKIGIEQAIESCRVFLVFMSTSSIMSKDCQWEMDIAKKLGKAKRVEYRLEDRRNNPKFAQFFDGIQWIDGAFNENYEDLSFRINDLLSEPEEKMLSKPSQKPSLQLLTCSRCGGELEAKGDGTYHCRYCRSIYKDGAYIGEEPILKKEPKPSPKADPKEAERIYQNGKRLANSGDLEGAAKEYKKAAEMGNAMAQVSLGYAYQHGLGLPKDPAEGTKWYRLSAEQGYSLGQFNMGVLYRDGIGVKQDYAEALKWFRKAADQGDIDALNSLGFAYEKGRAVPVDLEKAFSYYRKAAEGGLPTAMRNLGLCYQAGTGTKRDLEEAFKWIAKAAEKGNVDAFTSLGLCYDCGKGVAVDKKEAVKWYRKGAEKGDYFAQYNLAICYRDGEGVEKDGDEYLKWLRKAADQGYKSAEFNMGRVYANGDLVPKDDVESAKWYRKAAVHGHLSAMQSLAACYRDGKGVPKDLDLCFQWNKRAADLGDVESINALGVCYEMGRGTPVDLDKAAFYYKKAAEGRSRSAMYNLGLCYRDGKGVPKNPKEAEKWFEEAVKAGEPNAPKALEKLRAAK